MYVMTICSRFILYILLVMVIVLPRGSSGNTKQRYKWSVCCRRGGGGEGAPGGGAAGARPAGPREARSVTYPLDNIYISLFYVNII